MKRVNKKKRRRRILVLILCPCLILGLLIGNWSRIRLWTHGYSLSEQAIILELSKEERQKYLEVDHIDFETWDQYSNHQHYYDYDLYQQIHSKISKKKVIQYVDTFYDTYSKLEDLDYSLDTCRDYIQKGFTNQDFKYLANSNVSYKKAKKYISVNGFVAEDLKEYVQTDSSPEKAVLSISHSQIDSSNSLTRDYRIEEPSNILVLIKKGYGVSSKYKPDDLVSVNMDKASKKTPNQLRKEAAEALEQMAKDASKKDLHLVINSAYRSYKQQESVYNQYHEEYDQATADSLVAVPGYSEHQLGLGVDMTSQSVVDEEYNTFGETKEYQWMIKNAYKYGYILRYPEDKTEITGTANEPWHFRYVGKEAAKIMHDKDWTLEEYIQHKGFDYELKLQDE